MSMLNVIIKFICGFGILGLQENGPPFWGVFNKKDDPGGITTQVVEDPYKTAVSSPLSKYLASEVGKGLPAYTGKLTPDVSSSMQEYLSMNPDEWFKKNIQDPTVKNYQENIAPIVKEGYAGGLRGSGRFAGEEAGYSTLSSNLATLKEKSLTDFGTVSSKYHELLATDYQTQYKAWLQTLPEYNPMLQDAISFLGADSGYEILSGVKDPSLSFEHQMLLALLGATGKVAAASAGAGA